MQGKISLYHPQARSETNALRFSVAGPSRVEEAEVNSTRREQKDRWGCPQRFL
jgi:hypothetical protein